MVLLFLGAVALMFQWRFQSGDVYGPGSTMRSDPLGCRAYYESLAAIPGMEVSRNFDLMSKVVKTGGEGRSFLVLGMPAGEFDQRVLLDDLDDLKTFVDEGAHLVLTMNAGGTRGEEEEDEDKDPHEHKKEHAEDKDEEADSSDAEKEGADKGEEDRKDAKDDEKWEDFSKYWGFSYEAQTEGRIAEGWQVRKTDRLKALQRRDLPRWHSPVVFEGLAPEWEVLGKVEGKAVLVRRRIGKGAVVMATDNYFATNEALANARAAEFLAWLTGGNRILVFDETQHGTVSRLGVIQLAKQYRLHGFFAGLAVFVVLLAWRSGSSLLPFEGDQGIAGYPEDHVSGDESAAGLRKLVRRSVQKRDLLKTCHDAWREKSAKRPLTLTTEQMEAVERVVREKSAQPRGKSDPAGAYREIVEILAKRI